MNKKLILVFGLFVSGVFAFQNGDSQARAMVASLARDLPSDDDYESPAGFDGHSVELVTYQAPRTVAAQVQDPDAVIAAIKKMCGDCAKLVEAIDDLVTQRDEKELTDFEAAGSQVSDVVGDITAANARKDRVEEMSLLMDQRGSD